MRSGRPAFSILLVLAASLAPTFVSAHEVYVLSPQDISHAMRGSSMRIAQVISDNAHQFIFWAFLSFLVVSTVFFMSISNVAERLLDPFFFRIKRFAPLAVRFSVGISLLASAYHQALFGPELPFTMLFGSASPLATVFLALAGVLAVVGVATRTASLITLVVYLWGIRVAGIYMLTYAEYLDALIMIFALDTIGTFRSRTRGYVIMDAVGARLKPYRFALLRVLFGVALIFASVYAKLLHTDLTLLVVQNYHLTDYWLFAPFEPHFLVLGAALIEILCGIFFIIGFEIRHTSLFIIFWLTLSLFFFGESVWPHIILFGVAFSFVLYGYDRYSLEGRYFKKGLREPVL